MAYIANKNYASAVVSLRKALEINPKHVEAQFRIAQLMAQTDNQVLLEDAQTQLKALMESTSATPEMLKTLAWAELKLGDIDSADETLTRALKEFPLDLGTYLIRAKTRLGQNDMKGAEEALNSGAENLPKSSDAHRVLGEFYLTQKRLGEAEPQFRLAIGLKPNNAQALNDLARLQLVQGKKSEAEQSFRQLTAFQGYRAIYGQYLFQDGQHEAAIRELEKVTRENADDRQVRGYLLSAYAALNRTADIDRVLAEALKKNPKDAEARLQRAELLLKRGSYDAAEVDLNTAAKFNPATPEVHYLRARLFRLRGSSRIYRQELGDALQLNPSTLAIRLELAQDFVNSGDGKTALDILDGALQSQKSAIAYLIGRNWALWTKGDLVEMRKGIDAGLAQRRLPAFLLQDGLWKFRSGNPAGAQAAVREALQIDPTNLFALQILNSTYTAQKTPTVALAQVKEYAARVPKSAAVQTFLGQMLLASGDRVQARAVFTAAKALAPTSLEPELSLIQLDYLEHRFDDGRDKLQNVLATNPSHAVARLWLGVIEEKRGQHAAAMDHFRRVLAINPDEPMAANDLAYILAENTNNLDEALKYAQKAVELDPAQSSYADTLGWIFYRKGLYPSAVQYLEKASQDPGNVVAKYHLAMAYAKAGNRPHSVSTLQSAMKLDPGLPEAKIAQGVVGISQ
jgi:tetratricopeptide (TPR) repeat protein